MKKLQLYNTLTLKKELFKPIRTGKVGLYTCGPTVYNYAHIGNLRTYIFEDILKRILLYNGYKVKHVMNVTDVGHLTGDRDMGEDKIEASAKKQGKNAWEIADFYWQAFKADMKKLNLTEPDIWCKATEHITEQIEMVETLEQRGYTYRARDGIYFDSSKFKHYNQLSHQPIENLLEGARVEKNEDKKNPTDFVLWKFSPVGEKRQMEWDSPWGIGFPGWHIECSAMSLKYLKNQLDIHCGGIDHINVHHTNEIAQAEAATGRKFFNWWMHGAFLNLTGGDKMSKSADNFLTIDNALIKKGINPLAYRYASMQVHYRKPMEYSEKSILAAEKSLNNIYHQIQENGGENKSKPDKKYKQQFMGAINDDLNMPQALAIVWKIIKSKLDPKVKNSTLLDFDQVLGFGLNKIKLEKINIPNGVKKLAREREQARSDKNFKRADELRQKIYDLGFKIYDNEDGFEIKRNKKK